MSESVEAITDSTTEELDSSLSRNSLERVDDEFSPLSATTSFHAVVSKSHVKPVYRMVFPAKLRQDLPSTRVPAVIDYRGKTWETNFCGDREPKKLDPSWKTFVNENELKVGDALFWEVTESSNEKIKFKVQILRSEFPTELEPKVNGDSENTPIVLD